MRGIQPKGIVTVPVFSHPKPLIVSSSKVLLVIIGARGRGSPKPEPQVETGDWRGVNGPE
jgi:hypothetical protein